MLLHKGNTMRRVPSVSPEELQNLCRYRLRTGAFAISAPVSEGTLIRELEFHRFGLHYACLLPKMLQWIVFKIAASLPLKSDIPEMIEETKSQA
jgi:hypothetical protein